MLEKTQKKYDVLIRCTNYKIKFNRMPKKNSVEKIRTRLFAILNTIGKYIIQKHKTAICVLLKIINQLKNNIRQIYTTVLLCTMVL